MTQEKKRKIIRRMATANIPFAVAQTDNRKRSVIRIKAAVIQILYFSERLTQVEIAQFLHTTQKTVSLSIQNFNKYQAQDSKFRDDYSRIKKKYEYTLSQIP